MSLPREAAKIQPETIRNYVSALGWSPIATPPEARFFVYQKPGNGLARLRIPAITTAIDFGERVQEAISRLAQFVERDADSIYRDLTFFGSDRVRFRQTGAGIVAGFVHLDQGLGLLNGARRSLVASAHSVLKPQRFHPKLARSDAASLIEKCYLATENGSFLATITCPARDPEQEEHELGRKTVALLLRSIRKIVSTRSEAEIRSLVEKEQPEDGVLLSANLCDAVTQMEPGDEDAELTVDAAWAPLMAPPAGLDAGTMILLKQNDFETARILSKELRPRQEEETEMAYPGWVEELKGAPGADGKMQGEIILQLMVSQDEWLRTRAELNSGHYHEAWQAHGDHRPVIVWGKVIRNLRAPHRITDVSQLQIVAQGAT